LVSPDGVLLNNDIFHVGDFNGDGKSDFYHQYKHIANQPSKADVFYSTSNGSYHQQYTPNVDATYGLTTVPFDLNGDGRTEIVIKETTLTNLSTISLKKSGKENLLEKVENGVGLVTTWQYKNMTEGEPFYKKGSVSALVYPFHNVQLPMNLVSFFDNQDDGFNGHSYLYEEAKLHRGGKGFAGFKKVGTLDFISGYNTVSENEFNTTFFIPIPKQLTTTYDFDSPSVLVNQTTFTNELVNPVSNRYWIKTTSINQVDLGGALTTTTNLFDAFGNMTKSTVNRNNIETTVSDVVFGAFPGTIPNKSTSVTTTTTRTGQLAFVVNTTFSYNAIGQLISKTNFNGLPKSVTTNYEYFPLGNLKKTTITPAGPDVSGARSSSSVYDIKGRFPITTTNVLGQNSSATYDPKWAKILTATGIDGLITSSQYDVFGRIKKTILPEGYSIDQSYQWSIAGSQVWSNTVTHPGKPDVKTFYDKYGREVKSETEGFGGQTIIQDQSFDFKGNIKTATDPYKSGEDIVTETREYDEFNRLKTVSSSMSPIVGKVAIAYSFNSGNLTTTRTRKGVSEDQVSSGVTDPTGKTTSITDAGGTLSYSYYSHGGVKEIKNGAVTMITNEYDSYGRQSKLIDQNAGTTSYTYNALGELASQTNASNKTSTMQYDISGRNVSRSGAEGNTVFEYYPGNSGAATNQLKKVTGFAGNLEEYTYDGFGRVKTVKETVDGTLHITTYNYNIYGDITSTLFPSGFGINHAFDANGYPTTIKNAANTITLFSNTGMNGRGQTTNYALGNGLTSTNTYVYGFPTKMETAGKQNLSMAWNYGLGLLNSRVDAIKGKTESFDYDKLDRLKNSTIGALVNLTNYADNGNITNKADAGQYTYHATKINAVTGVTNPAPYPIPVLQQDITYTAFMQPEKVTEMGAGNIPLELSYTYGSDYERIKSISKQNGNIMNTRYYFGNYEKDISGASTKHLHYISSAAGLAAIVVREGGNDTYHYTYTDHLGSIVTLTNNAGTVLAEQNFDAWGRRRNPATWVPLPPTVATGLPGWLTRGYTGHEHLDNFGLINMNGRMYDPVVGRMLSPDNEVPDASSTQGYNRYTYAMNNPLSFTDPDGQNPLLMLMVNGAITSGIGYILGTTGHDGNKFNSGQFAQSLVSGAVSAGLSYGIGEVAKDLSRYRITSNLNIAIFQTASHALVQGAVSSSMGGSFKSGFASGLFGSISAASAGSIGGAAFVGGMSAKSNGGNFWQGAAQAGIVAAFNHAMHQEDPRELLRKSILADGRLTLAEANVWWRMGGGRSLTIDASKLDLGWVSDDGWESDGSKPVQTLFLSADGGVHGNIRITRVNSNQASIVGDYYNFEQYGTWLDHPIRNPATTYGKWVANDYGRSSGTRFWINYSGKANINQPRSSSASYGNLYPTH
jgi:RHS repeat-associated protein